jgi:thiazole synthase ThiGH ThiG subunit
MNTGIAGALDPVLMAEAMKHAVLAGFCVASGQQHTERGISF